MKNANFCRRGSHILLGALLWLCLSVGVFAHGAWLGGGGIALTPASRQLIADKMAAGLPPIEVGDSLTVIADFPVIAEGTLDGPGGYSTLYVPAGTQVVSTYITDVAGNALDARPARASTGSGVSKGWGPKGQQVFDISANGWDPSDTAQCQAAGYSIANCNAGLAYTYGDTGIFYSNRSDTALFANGSTIATLQNGYLVNPTNGAPWPSVGGTGTPRVHNKWDAVQINAFGSGGTIDPNGFSAAEETTITGGRGATPFRAGSPVAGPESGADWDRYGTTGPWNRISYPSSCEANDPLLAGPDGPATGAGSVFPEALDPGVNTVEVCTETTAGFALNSSTAAVLPVDTNAVRYAFGGIAQGETYYATMEVKITDLDAIGHFNAEGHGGDSAEGAAAGNDNPWRYWVAGTSAVSPAGPDDLFVSITVSAVNGAPYSGGAIPQGATLTYRVSYVNTSLSPMTNIQTTATLPAEISGTDNFRVVTGADIRPAVNPGPGIFSFATLPTLNGLGSGAIEFDAYVATASGGTITADTANSSDEGGADTDSVTVNVTAEPTDTLPVCNGSLYSAVDWANDHPGALDATSTIGRYGINGTVIASANSSASFLRPASIGTSNQLYATGYGGNPLFTQQYTTLEVNFDTPLRGVSFFVASLDFDESVTVYGENGGVRVQPAVADGSIAVSMLRVANADGSVLAERDNGVSGGGLAENSAVNVGFGAPVDRIVIAHTTRQYNGASFAGSLQLTDIQACADFTDAPTIYGDALHALPQNATVFLGATVSGDTGPGNASDAGSDDDDGVDIPPLVQGFLATIEATVQGAGGNLTAWIDYDGNSIWDVGTAEEIAINLQDDGTGADTVAGDGLIQFEVIVPGDAVLDQTFARFRWSTAPTLGIADAAPDGEVEDFPINIAAAPLVDRGDAPASYGDPLHIIAETGVAGTYLGALSPDPEAASQASPDASGDDLDGNDDEDGVVLPQFFAGGTTEVVVVVNEVTGGVGGITGGIAYLQAWIDFDGNGTFDASDQIATNLQDGSAGDKDGVLNGEIRFDVSVPATSVLTPTFARFRWSTTEGVVPVALDGEVEDYLTTISGDVPPVSCDSGLYLLADDPNQLRKIGFTDTGAGYAMNLQTFGTAPRVLEAGWGYNELDGYIYGVRPGKDELWRVDGAGEFTEMPNFPGSADRGEDAGDVLTNGILVYEVDGVTWQLLDLTDPSNPLDAGQLALSQTVTVSDFAVNPLDGFIYGINEDTGRVFRVFANNGVAGLATVIEFGPADYTGIWSAVFFDENGRMYAYEEDSNAIYLIDTTSGNRLRLATGPEEGGFSDGASCRGGTPFALSGFGGNIYIDQNASDVKDVGEINLGGGIAVDLYSDNGTPNDLSDDSFLRTTDTETDGTYAFVGLPAGATYRVEVDVNDPDLPPGSQIGTSNPLVGVTADTNSFTVARDFGFDPQNSDLSITKEAFQAGTTSPVTTAVVGDVIDWVVSVTNSGPGSPSSVRVIERIPSGFAYISDTAPPTGDYYDPGTGEWFVDEILSGATETLTVRVRVTAGGDYTNVAEITASSLPDLDSDPAVGLQVDDLSDGIADDDEAFVTIELATTASLISGRLIRDNGAGGGTAHDGLATGGESGTSKGSILLMDDSGALLANPVLDANGRWSYSLAAGYTGDLTVSVSAAEGWRAISEAPGALPGLVNTDPHDGTYSFTPASGTNYSDLNLGVIPLPTLSEHREASIGAGQIALLPHLYRARSSGTVSFAYTEVTQPSVGAFSVALFLDSDCDGNPDQPLNDPTVVQVGEQLCLISRVSSGGGLPPGSVLAYKLEAATQFTGTTVSHAIFNQDRVTVEVGGGQLVLVKTVRNETQNTLEGYSNSALPGDVLVYRITIINPSRDVASGISIHDRTPPYSELAEVISTPVNVGPTLVCSVADPGTNFLGYIGPLRWDCSGSHGAGAEGSVSFKVRVSP
ncbi:conserved repeat domain-containing protein [Sulfitobacter brevis]|uniref:Conserved repeat domain-containing protein n=1 Tax=Sulfitobacter brevis TaxID=74348 RepID=A0A1I2DTF6_9RHOB|nr:DUF11 domain-containing protein [Sulfitobacter brevis]SFE83994.1 conserved repeat domain-containing protein [Sulfitobacter brevis]